MTKQESDSIYEVLVRRALAAGDPSTLQVHFEVAVLDKYRGAQGFSIIRTDTVGRVQKQGAWSIDFGIAPGETLIHASFSGLMGLPEAEREHWAFHAEALPASRMFLQQRFTPAACFDDGEVRRWE